jgi:hypothetical protein
MKRLILATWIAVAPIAPAYAQTKLDPYDIVTGTTAGTVAAGNDSRITGAAQTANNLSDLTSPATATINLGLGPTAQVTFGGMSVGNQSATYWNKYGVPALQVGALGAVGTVTFPTGVTGSGYLNSAGGQVFGFYGPTYANTTGTATNELDSFNLTSTSPDASLPPNRSFGTSTIVPIALTLGAGGKAASSMALEIVQEGSSPQSFQNGIYFSPQSVLGYGIFLDATATQGAVSPLTIKTTGVGIAENILVVGPYAAANAVFTMSNTTNGNFASIKQDGTYANGGWTLGGNGILTGAAAATLTGTGPQPTNLGSAGAGGSPVALVGAQADQSYYKPAETSGFVVTYANNQTTIIIEGSVATLASGTVKLPPAPIDGQIARLACGVSITTLALQPNNGQALRTPSTSACAPGTGHAWMYTAASASWYGLY